MIKPEQLYNATSDGLDILALHYPEVRDAAKNRKPFKTRPDERTPSTSVKLFRTKEGGQVWKVTDFGDDGRATDPIAVHMKETGLRFPEAILDLSQIFNVTDEINRSVNRPDIRKQPATAEQEDGQTYWEIDQEFTEKECKVMGPRVKPEHLKALHWYRVKWLVSVKNREATYKYGNENYPIFMRECWFTDAHGKQDRFYKIYEPLNADKQWRFQYQPRGKKPQNYINGLSELAAAWTKYNEQEEKSFRDDPANEDKTYEEKKLPEAIICSGERDSLCVRSLRYHPLWFNSETYQLSEAEWKQINKYVETVYNIPDIDSTGRRKGTELALRFIDVQTIWLPSWLSIYKDNRGKPRKDFRDWMELRKEPGDFRGLLELATPAKFWKTIKTEKTGQVKYSIDISCLSEFLKLNGFYCYQDKKWPAPQIIKIENNVVKTIGPRDVRAYVQKWAIETAKPRGLRNLILTTPYLSASLYDTLETIELDFSNNTEKTQLFFFPKFCAEVSAAEIVRHDYKNISGVKFVWEEDIIGHDIRFLPDMFRISHPANSLRSEDFDIEVLSDTSSYFRYLINTSRIFWRKELETELENIDPEEAAKYRKENKFNIAGPLLTPEEIQEQKQCLINKIFLIGYLLHRFKSESRAWAPFVMDNIVGENGQCNGRSGKSFLFRALEIVTKSLKMSGRTENLLDNKHAFEQVNDRLGFVLVDDCSEYFPFKSFYDVITSEITINAKNVSAYNLKYADAPKFAFTTNYVPKEFNSSSSGRFIYSVTSDYYHEISVENDYLENRAIRDDFGKDLYGSQYTEAEWEADINFMMQCVRFYLSIAPSGVKILPQMRNIIFRKNLSEMSENFREWAEGYFAQDEDGCGDNLNVEIIREKAFEDYKRFSGVTKITMQKFSKSLQGFCYTCDYIESLNPKELHTSGGRILRRVDVPGYGKLQKEMIYIRTVKEAMRLKNPPPPPPKQLSVFDVTHGEEAPF